jgi:hypothetical protein
VAARTALGGLGQAPEQFTGIGSGSSSRSIRRALRREKPRRDRVRQGAPLFPSCGASGWSRSSILPRRFPSSRDRAPRAARRCGAWAARHRSGASGALRSARPSVQTPPCSQRKRAMGRAVHSAAASSQTGRRSRSVTTSLRRGGSRRTGLRA